MDRQTFLPTGAKEGTTKGSQVREVVINFVRQRSELPKGSVSINLLFLSSYALSVGNCDHYRTMMLKVRISIGRNIKDNLVSKVRKEESKQEESKDNANEELEDETSSDSEEDFDVKGMLTSFVMLCIALFKDKNKETRIKFRPKGALSPQSYTK